MTKNRCERELLCAARTWLEHWTTLAFKKATGIQVLFSNTTGNNNTAIGLLADVFPGNLTTLRLIGNGAIVNASNKIRLGNAVVTVIEGQVPFTAVSDKTKKENFQPVDGEAVLGKIRGVELSSWNFIGHDPKSSATMVPWRKTSFWPSATTD